MGRMTFVIAAGVSLFASILVGQGRLEIRAAATSPVSGWQQLPAPDPSTVLWVSPTNQLTAADVERIAPSQQADGRAAVTVVLTDAGARKMAEFSAGQIGKPLAILLDGKVISAPIVRGVIQKEATITGGPNGLTPDEVQRLLAILK